MAHLPNCISSPNHHKLVWPQGNWGIALQAYGPHKRTYLSMLEEEAPTRDSAYPRGVIAREEAALEASRARLREEARQALVKAGQLFREVVQVRQF